MKKMSRHVISKKGQAILTETLLIIFLSAAIVVAALQIPRIIKDFIDLMTLASAEATARDLAGLITVSGAATDSATIKYEGEDYDIFYDVRIEDRIVYVTGVRKEGELIMETEYSPLTTGWGKIAVGDISRIFIDTRVFNAEKIRTVTSVETYDDYDVSHGLK